MNPKYKIAILISVAVTIPTLFLEIFGWNLVEMYTAFIMAPIELAALALLVIACLGAFVFFIVDFAKNRRVIALAPFIIIFIVLIIRISGISTTIHENINFRLNYTDRMKVVKMIESGELKTSKINHDIIRLPDKYQRLSTGGGEIFLPNEPNDERIDMIGFYFYRGILDDYIAFVYKKSDGDLTSFDVGEEDFLIKKLRPHWYLISP